MHFLSLYLAVFYTALLELTLHRECFFLKAAYFARLLMYATDAVMG